MLHSSDSKALLAKGPRRERIVVVDRFDVAWLDNRRLPIDFGGAKTRRKDYALPWFLKRAIEKAGASCRPSVKLRAVWWFFSSSSSNTIYANQRRSSFYKWRQVDYINTKRICDDFDYVLAVQPCQQIIADLRRTTAFPVFPWISTQQYSPAYLAEDKSREFLNVVVAFAILETVFMILFFTSRAMNKTSNGWDVYLMIPGYIFCFGHIVVASCMFKASLQDTEMR